MAEGSGIRFQCGASITEDEAPKLVSKAFHIFRIACGTKAIREIEEGSLLLLAGFEALFDELHEHTVIAQAAPLCGGINFFRHFPR